MDFKSLIGSVCIFLSVVSFNANAVFISHDLHNAGDGLYTIDTDAGLDWLDLTVTSGRTYSEVNALLSTGGLYEGWRRATNQEVLELWSAFSINLSPGAPTSASGWNDNVASIANYLGNTTGSDWLTHPYRVLGVTASTSTSGFLYYVGAYTQQTLQGNNRITVYDTLYNGLYSNNDNNSIIGSYVVREVSSVPIPAAVWLFGSGLIGLAGIARRKKS